jgi:hypothetical protein
MRSYTVYTGSGQGTERSSSNKLLGSIKGLEYYEQLTDYWLLTKHSAPKSWHGNIYNSFRV